jgi:pimeloyl-ACP methyl ester carboxylesterase
MTEVRSVSLPNGVRLEYVEQGDPGGVPVVFLHGVTDSWRSFQLVLPHLPSSIRAFAVSQRGHGDSARPDSYRAKDFAQDIREFADAVGIGRFVLVGHSMGATNAQRFAIDHPERLRGLVFIGSFGGYSGNAVIEEFWTSELSRLEDPITDRLARGFQESTLARRIPAWYLEAVVAESRKVPARVWRACFAAFRDDECTAELGRIRVPTLLLWGDRDALAPREDQSIMLDRIPGSRLVVYEGCGHALHWEDPQRFASDVTEFCRELSEDSGGAR